MLAAALFAAAFPCAAFAADTATLTVKLEDVTGKGGNVLVAIYDAQSFSTKGAKALAKMSAPAKAGEVTVTFEGLAPGAYGLKAMQDENANGKMDFFLGMPTEPYGFSNNPVTGMSAPQFDDAKIVLKPGANSTIITLHGM
jgi:uncharacterized protein (DUF2141 family)